MSLFVRPFQAGDRESLLQIGAETAFFGAPIEAYMEDRRIFMDGFYAYYTDYEPEHAWVACDGDRVVGFLTGCADGRRHNAVLRRKILPAILLRFLTGYYHPGPKTWRYVSAAAGAALRGEIPGADEKLYPAHLHTNLLPDWRGHGLGRKLMEAWLGQLRGLGVPGVHLQTTSMNATAIMLYEKVGFRLLSAKSTRMYAAWVSQPVENRCYGLRFADLPLADLRLADLRLPNQE